MNNSEVTSYGIPLLQPQTPSQATGDSLLANSKYVQATRSRASSTAPTTMASTTMSSHLDNLIDSSGLTREQFQLKYPTRSTLRGNPVLTYKELQDELERAEKEIQGNDYMMEQCDMTIVKMTKELAHLKQSHKDEMRDAMKPKDEEITSLSKQVASLTTQLTNQAESLTNQMRDRLWLSDLLNKHKAEIEEYKAEIQGLYSTIAELNQQINQQSTTITSLNLEIDIKDSESRRKMEEMVPREILREILITEQKDKIAKLEAELADKQKTYIDETAALKTQITALQRGAPVTVATDKPETLQKLFTAEQEKIRLQKQLLEQQQKHQVEIKNLHDTFASKEANYQKTLQSSQQTLTQQSSHIKQLTQQISQLEAQIKDLQSQQAPTFQPGNKVYYVSNSSKVPTRKLATIQSINGTQATLLKADGKSTKTVSIDTLSFDPDAKIPAKK